MHPQMSMFKPMDAVKMSPFKAKGTLHIGLIKDSEKGLPDHGGGAGGPGAQMPPEAGKGQDPDPIMKPSGGTIWTSNLRNREIINL